MTRLSNVMQGGADVIDDQGNLIGSVQRQYGGNWAAGWYAYGKDGKRISDDPNPKRDMAVREVVAATAH